MNLRLGQDGYAFAEIHAVPDLDRETKQAAVTFFVDPKNRVYVRRINFNGSDSVNDEVLRREMRQLEGGYLSNSLVDRSKILLQRLPYIEKVDEKTNPVAGSPDLVDVDFDIKEGLPGQFGGSLGFSETYGVTLGGQFIHSNFMGTGKRVALQLTGGEYQKVFDVNFTDPYRNIDGVGRTLSLTYQHLKQFTSVTSDFSTTTLSAGMNWGYPITNYQNLRFGFAYQDAELLTSIYSSQQALDWVTQNGRTFDVASGVVGTRIRSLELVAGWSYDTRNASLFPTAGTRLAINLNAAVPGSDVEYYTTDINFQKYISARPQQVALPHEQRGFVRRGVRLHDLVAAVSQSLRRRAGLGARIQGELSRTRRFARQSLRRQHGRVEPVRADRADAGQDLFVDARVFVLRRGRRVLDRGRGLL